MSIKTEDLTRLSQAARQWTRLARGERVEPLPEKASGPDLPSLAAQIGGLMTTLSMRHQVEGAKDPQKARLLWEGRHLQALLMKAVFAPPDDTTLRPADDDPTLS